MDFTDPLIAVSSELPLKVIPKDSYGNEIDISQKLVLLNIKEVYCMYVCLHGSFDIIIDDASFQTIPLGNSLTYEYYHGLIWCTCMEYKQLSLLSLAY